MGLAGFLQKLIGYDPRAKGEGTSVRKADVRALPGDPAARRRADHLLEPAPQAAAGVTLGAWHG
jgi:hypothetical protein